jgi:hypothetical protein
MIDGGLLLLFGYILAKRSQGAPIITPGVPGKPKVPEQVPFPQNAPTPAPPPAPRGGPVVLPEILITPSPGVLPASAPVVTPGPALPVAAAVPKKRAVEVWRVRPENHGRTVADMQKQFPAGWQPSHPPTGTEIGKAQSLLGGWRKGGIHWDLSSPGTPGARAYWYLEH